MKKYSLKNENARGCVVSNNILRGNGALKWCFREEPVQAADNGWRFLSDIDTEEYINCAENMSVCDINAVAEIEPAIKKIYHFSIGSDLELVTIGGEKVFLDSATRKKIC